MPRVSEETVGGSANWYDHFGKNSGSIFESWHVLVILLLMTYMAEMNARPQKHRYENAHSDIIHKNW